MLSVVISVFAFIFAISILVVVHEWGHFWMARRFGIKVLRFSVGFGRPLYSWYDRLGTEYVISAIPLGGYVAMLGEKGDVVTGADKHLSFESKPVLARMLVILAGPLSNLLFAVLAFWFLFMMGITVLVPVLGNVPKDSLASMAGLHRGQEIIAIEDRPVFSWDGVSRELLSGVGEDKLLSLRVQDIKTHQVAEKQIDLSHVDMEGSDWLSQLGLSPIDPFPALITKVTEDSPAQKGGLKRQDLVIRMDEQIIDGRMALIDYIKSRPNTKITVEVQREGKPLSLSIVTGQKYSEAEQKDIGIIGIELTQTEPFPKEYIRIMRFGPMEGLTKAFIMTRDYTVLTLEVFKKMLLGKISTRHVSGPLMIAKFAGETATSGLQDFLHFLAMISISVGVLNALPVPILDGGQFVFCVYELVIGRKVSLWAQKIGMWIGVGLLVCLMTLAFYNDLVQLFKP